MKNLKTNLLKSDLSLIAWVFLALLPISGTFIYYIYALNNLGLILSFLISAIIGFFVFRFVKNERVGEKKVARENIKSELESKTKESIEQDQKKLKNSKLIIKFRNSLPSLLFILFIFLSFRELWQASFNQALISPWQVVSLSFFLFYGLSALLLLIILKQNKILNNLKLLSLAIFYFLSFSVALITYLIGYGFDPFIHQATMEYISEHGFISPKTPYYVGQYSLIIILSKFINLFKSASLASSPSLALSLEFIHKLLVPLLGAITLPALFWNFLKKESQGNKSVLITILTILFIGFSPLIVTTPQNLSYIFLLALIFFTLREKSLLMSLLFAGASMAIHPLSGLPAFGFILFAIYEKKKTNLKPALKKIGLVLVSLINIIALPLALYLGAGAKLSFINFKSSSLNFLKLFFNFKGAGQENIFLNLNYFFNFNQALIILIIIICASIYFYQKLAPKKDKNSLAIFRALSFSALALIFSYLLSNFIAFNEVISYEQADYAKRILTIIIIFNLPFVLLGLQALINKCLTKNLFSQIFWALFLIILLTTSLYSSYPRIDKYFNSRGYSTSNNDIEAVKSIAEKNQANGSKKYIVLANQQVSAGALKTFGFNNYLDIEDRQIYFYPIPTGGELYNYYLEAVYNQPNKKTLKSAMEFAGVNEAYLIINKYWNRSAELINEAKLEADEFWSIENEIFIFRYLNTN
ncbi:hypothetical protein JXK06_01450 [Patescibacteria group bacterium]|nr:hypothetical protein [Patescibacteria group bacterium]